MYSIGAAREWERVYFMFSSGNIYLVYRVEIREKDPGWFGSCLGEENLKAKFNKMLKKVAHPSVSPIDQMQA